MSKKRRRRHRSRSSSPHSSSSDEEKLDEDAAATKASLLAAVISARLKSTAAQQQDESMVDQPEKNGGPSVVHTDEKKSWNLDDEGDMEETDEVLTEAARLGSSLNDKAGARVRSLDVARLREKYRPSKPSIVIENDPLDEFLESFDDGTIEQKEEDDGSEEDPAEAARRTLREERKESRKLGRLFNGDGDVMEETERRAAERSALEVFAEQLRKKELKAVDHDAVEYPKIRKNLYVVPKSLQMSQEEVEAMRSEDDIKIRGIQVPPPVERWSQCGLTDKADALIRKRFGQDSVPFPIQKQAIPVLMSGRDAIGIAKTGSGKTLAFALPALRHAADQPPVVDGSQGPIVMIMAPARELALQIYRETKRFAVAMGGRQDFRCACVYGGARVSEQIADLKRGAEVVVCTPGRMIDLLTMQQGRMLGLTRVSFVVLDEADRMFDMGFEPQIAMILRNTRPDRQTALFSATFPRTVETLARKTLTHPVEIIVGGRSVAAEHVEQFVEVREEQTKFMRLLQLLGVWYERGSTLIFVDTQNRCDSIYGDLVKSGYACLALHGGHEQADRESTINDFKQGVANVLVATSVAGRGLDVPAIKCVINYSAPNHLEDYVHRVGRTGRAGKEGTAYTFLDPINEDAFAPMLLKALKQSKQHVSDELKALAAKFKTKVVAGEATWANDGFAGSKGYTFDEDEMTAEQKRERAQKQQFEIDIGVRVTEEDPELRGDVDDEEDEEGNGEKSPPEQTSTAVAESSENQATAQAAYPFNALAESRKGVSLLPEAAQQTIAALSQETARTKNLTPVERAKILAATFGKGGNAAVGKGLVGSNVNAALEQARALAASIGGGGVAQRSSNNANHFTDELDINDYPPEARLRATHRESINRISEETGAAIIHRGSYCAPGKQLPVGEKRLHVVIEASSELSVQNAKAELLRVLNEELRNVSLGLGRGGRAAHGLTNNFGKYALI